MDSESNREEDHPHDTHFVRRGQVIGDDDCEKYDSLNNDKAAKLNDFFLPQFIVVFLDRGLFESEIES